MRKINLTEYNIQVDKDITESLKILFEDIKNTEDEKILELDNGFYFLSKLEFNKREVDKKNDETYFSSVLSNIKNLKIVGKDRTTIVINDYISYFAIINSCNITIENIIFRTDSPNLHKLRVKQKEKNIIDYRLSNSSEFKLKNGRIYCVGSNCEEPIIAHEEKREVYRFVNYRQTTLREEEDVFVKVDSLSEIRKNELRVIYKRKIKLNVNDEIYITDKKQNNCGFYIFNSENINFKNVTVNFSYSDLFKCVNSKDLTFREIRTIPSKGIRISILRDAFFFYCCSGNVTIEKCNIVGVCAHCVKVYNPIYQAKLIEGNILKIKKENYSKILLNIRENDEIVFANYKFIKPSVYKKAKIKRIIENEDTILLEIDTTDIDLSKRIKFFNKSRQLEKFSFNFNRVDKICKNMLSPQAEVIEIKNNQLIDTDKNFINISQGLYSQNEKATGFISKKIYIISNTFGHSTDKYITIYSDAKLSKNTPYYAKVLIRKNIYQTNKRKLVRLEHIESLIMLENSFCKIEKERKK